MVATSPFATGTSSGSTVSGVAAQMIEGTKPPAMPARIMMPQYSSGTWQVNTTAV